MRTIILGLFLFASVNKNLLADIDICPFCNPKVLKSQVVFETNSLRVLVDYAPVLKGHLLVIPKRHIVKAHEMIKEEWEELSIVIPKIVDVFSEHLEATDYIILEKNGPRAFQDIPHVHFHLLPVGTQTWSDIFNIIARRQLKGLALEKEVLTFQGYFLKQQSDTCAN